jgi:1,3-beta-glucanosyltransferase GAS1
MCRMGRASSRGSYHTPQPCEFLLIKLTSCRFTREGVPTPVQPDFSNLQAQWATATPSGVSSAQYAAKVKTTPPPCPAFTAGGWTVNPSEALPTVGAEGVSAGMPSGVPTGSITATVITNTNTTTPAARISNTYGSTGPSTTNGGASSATSSGAAGKTTSNPVSNHEVGFTGMVVALLAVGAGVMLLL